MPDVGVRELKQRPSEYLDRAAGGELLRVTDRGRPKALLGPLPGRARIGEGIEQGWITPGSGASLRDVRRWTARERVLDALSDDRGTLDSSALLQRYVDEPAPTRRTRCLPATHRC